MAGCNRAPEWRLQYVPTTDAERAAVAAHVEKIMAATPRSLAGNDQDWDDTLRVAESRALELFVRPTLREWTVAWDGWPIQPTGRWRYVDAQPTQP